MKRFVYGFLIASSCCLLTADAQAGLLVNGGFEQAPTMDGKNGNSYADIAAATGVGGSWDVWGPTQGGLPGWKVGSNGSSTTQGIEIQTANTVGLALDPVFGGTYYAELDSDPSGNSNSTMYQTVDLQKLGTYELTFLYSPRVNTNGTDTNGILAYYEKDNGSEPLTGNSIALGPAVSGPPSPPFGAWTRITRSFTLSDASELGLYHISLAAVGGEDKLGGFVDDVTLNFVPEPTAFMTWAALGLVGVAGRRRRRRS